MDKVLDSAISRKKGKDFKPDLLPKVDNVKVNLNTRQEEIKSLPTKAKDE